MSGHRVNNSEDQSAADQTQSTTEFNDLPAEMICHIFQFLPQVDLRAVRLVCTDWENIAIDYFEYANKILDDESFLSITGERVKLKLPKLTITSLKNPEIRNSSFTLAPALRALCLQNAAVDLENIKWIFTKCSNLEEIQLERSAWDKKSRQRFGDFLNNVLLPTLTLGLGRNVTTFEFYAVSPMVFKSTKVEPYHFDCNILQQCPNLTTFNVFTGIPFALINFAKFPSSIRNFSFILVLGIHDSTKFYHQIAQDISVQFNLVYYWLQNRLSTYNPAQVESLRTLMPKLKSLIQYSVTGRVRLKFLEIIPRVIKRLNRQYVHTVMFLALRRSAVGWISEY